MCHYGDHKLFIGLALIWVGDFDDMQRLIVGRAARRPVLNSATSRHATREVRWVRHPGVAGWLESRPDGLCMRRLSPPMIRASICPTWRWASKDSRARREPRWST